MVLKETSKKYFCKCEYCGREFENYKSNFKRSVPKYCSPKCYHTASRKPIFERKCLYCGKSIFVSSKQPNKKFCNLKCSGRYRSDNAIHAPWQGENGYRYIWDKERHNMPEHIYIMEQHIGRRLTKDEVVHHIDFNRSNNCIENLQLMTRSEHSRLHRENEIKLYGKQKGAFGGWNKGHKGIKPHNATKVIRIEDGKIYESTGDAAKDVNGNCNGVWKACKGMRKSYKGFHFKYEEDV